MGQNELRVVDDGIEVQLGETEVWIVTADHFVVLCGRLSVPILSSPPAEPRYLRVPRGARCGCVCPGPTKPVSSLSFGAVVPGQNARTVDGRLCCVGAAHAGGVREIVNQSFPLVP